MFGQYCEGSLLTVWGPERNGPLKSAQVSTYFGRHCILLMLCMTLSCLCQLSPFVYILQQIQSNFVVVIHPGSRTLRIGRATDTLPLTIPHVIARRHKQSGNPRYEDAWLLREGLNVCHIQYDQIHSQYSLFFFYLHSLFLSSVQQKPESNEQRQNGLKMVDQAIWSKKMSNGVRRTPVSAEQVYRMKQTEWWHGIPNLME